MATYSELSIQAPRVSACPVKNITGAKLTSDIFVIISSLTQTRPEFILSLAAEMDFDPPNLG